MQTSLLTAKVGPARPLKGVLSSTLLKKNTGGIVNAGKGRVTVRPLAKRNPFGSEEASIVQGLSEDTGGVNVGRGISFTERAMDIFSQAGRSIAAIGLAGLILFAPQSVRADDIVRFPASANPEIFAVQKTLVEAWSIVRESFVDGDMGGKDWDEELANSLTAAYKSKTGDEAYEAISGMLEDLGDPYTRIIRQEQYADFRVNSDGELQGVGMLIAADPTSGKLVVLAPIRGGPADRAGVLPGDEVLSINGQSTQGWDGPRAAKFLRGRNGTLVTVKLARRSEQIPGVPGRPEPLPSVQYRELKMKREVVELSPVFYDKVEEAGQQLGYIRLTGFSGKAAHDVEEAIRDLDSQGVEAYILDLRGNPGGLVQAGMDVARLWLDGSPTIFNVTGRGSEETKQVGLQDGKALTDRPLVVVVNEDSASASEILAGALHDYHRAEIVGERTYGKGKIQSVFELQDGSALFVTVARYKTPEMHDIDLVGIQPDRSCAPDLIAPPPPGEGDGIRGPQGLREKTVVEADLEADDCFLAAERLLYKKTHKA